MLHNMILEDVAKDAAIVLIDSKGDLIEPIKTLASIKDRLLLIEPNADAAFALNPLDVSRSNVTQAVGLIEYIMAGLFVIGFVANLLIRAVDKRFHMVPDREKALVTAAAAGRERTDRQAARREVR